MGATWGARSPLSVQEVCTALGPRSNYKTVMTVLNRLVEKELLERQLDGRAYRYRPRISREGFLRAVAQEMVQGMHRSYGPEAVGYVAEAVAAVDPQRYALDGGEERERPRDEGSPGRFRPIALAAAAIALLQTLLYLRSRGGRRRE